MASVNFSRAQFKAIFDLPLDTPVMMLNLLRFRAHATYAQDDAEFSQPPISGAAAYQRYSTEAAPVFTGMGGSQVWIGLPELMLIGPSQEQWDLAFVAHYPTAQAFVDMIKNPAYQRAVRHRNAAVADSRLIRCSQAQTGTTFWPAKQDTFDDIQPY